jgi:hypothetical protein
LKVSKQRVMFQSGLTKSSISMCYHPIINDNIQAKSANDLKTF